MNIPTTNLSRKKVVLELNGLTGGYEDERPVIRDLSLTMTGPERIAITGPNGSGKTTLISLITGKLPPQSGTVHLNTSYAFLDQNVSLIDPVVSLRDNFMRLNPEANENQCRTALARFMFRSDAALQQAGTLSGGQKLRAGLACTLCQAPPPALLILDEPTNHLDLDAIKALEVALSNYDGALLVISHDLVFLRSLALKKRIQLPVQ
jgi:ATPase subunit of ABC transporter with duplicated ATPase domains